VDGRGRHVRFGQRDASPARRSRRSCRVSQFTNSQIGDGANDGATVATVPGAGCNTYDGVHITAYGNLRP